MVFFTEIPGVFFALPYECLFPVRIRVCRVDAAYITAKRETILAFAGLDSIEISSAFVHRDPVIPFAIASQEFSCFTVIAAQFTVSFSPGQNPQASIAVKICTFIALRNTFGEKRYFIQPCVFSNKGLDRLLFFF